MGFHEKGNGEPMTFTLNDKSPGESLKLHFQTQNLEVYQSWCSKIKAILDMQKDFMSGKSLFLNLYISRIFPSLRSFHKKHFRLVLSQLFFGSFLCSRCRIAMCYSAFDEVTACFTWRHHFGWYLVWGQNIAVLKKKVWSKKPLSWETTMDSKENSNFSYQVVFSLNIAHTRLCMD